MKNDLIIIGVGLVLGAIVYKVVTAKEESSSEFSSACGCGA
jgi:hypothetical protein